MSEIRKLINKLNNIEMRMGWTERDFYLGKKVWHISSEELFVDGKIASKGEIEEFLKLKREFDYD